MEKRLEKHSNGVCAKFRINADLVLPDTRAPFILFSLFPRAGTTQENNSWKTGVLEYWRTGELEKKCMHCCFAKDGWTVCLELLPVVGYKSTCTPKPIVIRYQACAHALGRLPISGIRKLGKTAHDSNCFCSRIAKTFLRQANQASASQNIAVQPDSYYGKGEPSCKVWTAVERPSKDHHNNAKLSTSQNTFPQHIPCMFCFLGTSITSKIF